MDLIDKASRLIFGSVILEDTRANPLAPVKMSDAVRKRSMNIGLIVMSHDTAREMMRADYGRTVFRSSVVRTEPDYCFHARVAYDDSMALGAMLVAETPAGVQ